MDLFELVGKLSIEGADKAEKQIKGVSEEGEQTSSKLSKLGGIAKTVGKGILIGTGAAVAGSTALIRNVSSSYGRLQQSIGGVETLFGKSSKKVIDNANKAFTTAGISANEYMEQITSFSASLLQSVGGDTEKAAKAGDMAVRDMADNANKMGTAMEDIQNAYQGFSKQNYTMLDNLKLGYGGTKHEMERLLADAEKLSGQKYDISNLSDVYNAIHVVQQELGITGTTAKEGAATVEGSFNSLGAAWENFIAGLGNPDADMKQLVANLSQTISAAVNNVTPIIENIVNILPEVSDSLLNAISSMLPTFIKTFTELITNVIDAIVKLLPQFIPLAIDCVLTVAQALIENLPLIIEAAIQLVQGLIDGISQAIPKLIPTIIDVVIKIADTLIANLPKLLEAGLKLILGLAQGIVKAIPQLIKHLPDLINGIVDFIVKAIPQIVATGVELITAWADALPQIIQLICDMLPQIIEGIVTGLVEHIPEIAEAGVTLFVALVKNVPKIIATVSLSIPKIIAAILKGLGQAAVKFAKSGAKAIKGFWDGMKPTLTSLPEKFRSNLALVIAKVIIWVRDLGKNAKNGGKTFFNNVISGIKELPGKMGYYLGLGLGKAAKFAVDVVKHAKNAGSKFITNFINFIKKLPQNIASWFSKTISNVASWSKSMVSKAKSAGSNFVNGVVNFVKKLPQSIANTLKAALSTVASWGANLASKGKDAAIKLKNAVVSGVTSIPKEMVTVGKNIVTGIWNGITGAASWLHDKVSSFCSGIVKGFKKGFDIHSPSRVMKKEVGEQIAAGLIDGVLAKKGAAKKSAEELSQLYVNAASNRITKLRKANKSTLADEVAIWQKIVSECKKGTKGYNAAMKNLNASKKELTTNLKSLEKQFIESAKTIKTELEKNISDVKSKYSESVTSTKDSIMSALNLFENFELDEATSKVDLTSNLKSQVDDLKEYNNTLQALKSRSGVESSGLYSELEKMDVKSLNTLKSLNSMSDEELNNYINLYKQKSNLATTISKHENEGLKKETDKQVAQLKTDADKQMTELTKQYTQALVELGVVAKKDAGSVGQNIVDGIQSGMNKKSSQFEKFLKSYFSKIEKTAKKTLKIKSPSRVMMEVGNFVSQGLGDGIEKNDSVEKSILNKVNSIVETAESANPVLNVKTKLDDAAYQSPMQKYQVDFNAQIGALNEAFEKLVNLVGQYLPGISENMDRNIVIDGSSLAVGMSRSMDTQLGKIATSRGRGNV